jgi:signal transduction histidine kinase
MNVDIDKIQKLQEFSKGLKVLYVEDNEEARASTFDTLSEFFNDITVAVDGMQGLEKFNNDSFDLIISDINMPNMNGIDMVSKIREKDKDIAILIISAYSESGYFMETIRLGVEGYLLKPIELEQFLSMLYKSIEKIKMRKEIQNHQKNLELQIQEQLSKIQKQNSIIQKQEKFAAMGEMIDTISHQFKQPLGIMKLRTQEIEFLIENNNHTNIKESLESINKQIDHSVNTIEEFRNFFRSNVKKETLSIQELFDSVLRLVKDEMIKNNIEVITEGDTSLQIFINPNEFKHVLLNLITNAKDALHENQGDNKTITLSANTDEDHILIRVKDNGTGVPQEIIHKIFEPNFTTKPSDKGTGIGLHISKMILEKIDATINMENKNPGAEFTIKIPKNN